MIIAVLFGADTYQHATVSAMNLLPVLNQVLVLTLYLL